jgi:hypothetical protein
VAPQVAEGILEQQGRTPGSRSFRSSIFLDFGPNFHPQDMGAIDQLLTTVEKYDKMTVQYLTVCSPPSFQRENALDFFSDFISCSPLQFSKIGKVMKHVTALPDEKVPRDEEFKFRQRAAHLVEVWQGIVNASKADGASSKTEKMAMDTEDPKTETAPAVVAAVEAAEPKAPEVTDAAPATEDVAMTA